MVMRAIRHLPNVEADSFEGLLVEYAERRSAQAVMRGLRAVSDFEFEFQLALMNRKLNERIETIFMMPKDTYTFLSSRIVKEIATLGGDVSAFVPAHVRTALASKLNLTPGIERSFMPIKVNLRHLEEHSLRLEGRLACGRTRSRHPRRSDPGRAAAGIRSGGRRSWMTACWCKGELRCPGMRVRPLPQSLSDTTWTSTDWHAPCASCKARKRSPW